MTKIQIRNTSYTCLYNNFPLHCKKN